jgi:hypothetical protein
MHGVAYYKPSDLWVARVGSKGLSEHIGYYDTKEYAAQAYNAHVTEGKLGLPLNAGVPSTWPPRHGTRRLAASKYRGVSKRPNGWMALLTVTKWKGGKKRTVRHYLGDFGDEISAAKAYNEACDSHGCPKRKNVL